MTFSGGGSPAGRQTWALAAAVLILALPWLPQGQERPEKQEEPIRVDVNLVTLRFAVRDQRGGFVNTLEQERFQILENGVPQDLVFFEPPRQARGGTGSLWLAFVIDVSGSTFATRSEEILAAETFFENLQEFTRIGIFGFTDKLLVFQDFTQKRSRALKAFTAARRHLGKTALYDSVNRLIERVASQSKPQDTRVLIVISDGMDDRYERASQTISLAQRHNIPLYTVLVPSASQLYIGPRSGDPSAQPDPELAKKESAFAGIAEQTGGRHFSGFEAILDFDETLGQINDEIVGNLYSLGYYAQYPSLDRSERVIQVQISQPGLSASGLFQDVPERLRVKKRFIAALFDNEAMGDLPTDLASDFSEIAAEMDVLPIRREGDHVGLPFRIKISPFALRVTERGVRTQLGVIGLLTDRNGKDVVRLREFFRVNLDAKKLREGRTIIYNNRLLAPPGKYALKVALLEVATWKLTAFEEKVEITAR